MDVDQTWCDIQSGSVHYLYSLTSIYIFRYFNNLISLDRNIHHLVDIVLWINNMATLYNNCIILSLRCNRSEEHTSELQSLMRISYAVFCLKKKKQHNNN